MTTSIRALVVIVVLGIVGVACGSDDGEETGGAPPGSPSPSGRALTVEEAIAAGSSGDEVVVQGALFVSDAVGIRLCGAVLESYPPQCGQPSLSVTGLDLATVELQSADDGSVSWAEGVELTGIVEGDELRVASET